MKIWLINNYNMLPEHGHLNRNYYLAKYLKRLGHEPVVFVGSHPHNTDLQLIEGKEKFKLYQKDPFPWILVKTRNYEGSKFSRVLSMFEFYFNLFFATKSLDKPDAIIGSTAHPLASLAAIQLAKLYKCQGIVEVRDLWPESIVSFGIAKRNNPIIKLMYKFEKYLYMSADKIIFTMEDAYKYLIEIGLDKIIDKDKVFYLNNGVDLEDYNHNLSLYNLDDSDLNDKDIFKVIYAGSIREANNVGLLLDVAKVLEDSSLKILIWGTGDELDHLKNRLINENITNVIFKGFVDKKYIPSITSKADLNIIHLPSSPVLKYGLSANKLFDYAASGKPILTDFSSGKNPATEYNAGISVDGSNIHNVANGILKFKNMSFSEYETYCNNATKLANDYSFASLSQKLIDIIES